jgi:hypothetical protein
VLARFDFGREPSGNETREKPMERMNGFAFFGAILALAGILGLAVPVFTTHKTENIARFGDLKIQDTHDVYHSIPPIMSGGALVLGIILIGTSVYRQR